MESDKGLSAKQREWLEHLELARASGVTLMDYARQLDLNVNNLYHWKHVFVRQGLWSDEEPVSTTPTAELESAVVSDAHAAPAFVPVQIAQSVIRPFSLVRRSREC